MTDDEVELIYDYLHANYEYRDGELVKKTKTRYGSPQGSSLGCFVYLGKFSGIRVNIRLNKKQYVSTLGKYIYLYHYKIHPDKLIYIDENPMNNRIENIKSIERCLYKSKSHEGSKGYVQVGNKFVSVIRMYGKNITLGSFIDADIATEVNNFARNLYINNQSSIDDIKKQIKIKYSVKFRSQHDYKYGFPGIFKRGNLYTGYFSKNNKRIRIGNYKTPEEAHAAYLKAKEEYK